jgi:hypothetical protein
VQLGQSETKQIAPLSDRPERRRPLNSRAGLDSAQRFAERIRIVGFDRGNTAARKSQSRKNGVRHRDSLRKSCHVVQGLCPQ